MVRREFRKAKVIVTGIFLGHWSFSNTCSVYARKRALTEVGKVLAVNEDFPHIEPEWKSAVAVIAVALTALSLIAASFWLF